MKKLVLLWLLTFVPGVLAVDSFRFTERLTDSVAVGGVNIATVDAATITGSFTMPNLAGISFTDTNTTFNLEIGALKIANTLAAAKTRSLNSATILIGNAIGKQVGTITLTRVGSKLNLTANFTDTSPNSIIAAFGAPQNGTESGRFSIKVEVGQSTYSAPAFYKITKTVRRQGQFVLRTFSVVGEFDFLKPTVTITSPRPSERLLSEPTIVSGKALDAYGLTEVRIYVGTNLVQVATNFVNGAWSAPISLEPGPQTISAESVDLAGNPSTRLSVKVTRVVTAQLGLTIDAGGKVTGATNGQYLEIGKSYTLRAAPLNRTNIFDGWISNGTTNMNPALTFTMANGTAFHAAFGTNIFLNFNGTFSGLFRPDPIDFVPTPTNSGYYTMTISSSGVASGRISMGGASLPFSAVAFNSQGNATFAVKRTGKTPLLVSLQVGVQKSAPTSAGTVTDGVFTSRLRADKQPPLFRTWDGYFTMGSKISQWRGPQNPPDDPLNVPIGIGTASILISNGHTSYKWNLPDGTFFSGVQPLGYPTTNAEVRLPIYASLQGGKGMYMGWLLFSFENQFQVTSVDEDGQNSTPTPFTWTKAPSTTGYYKNGFTNFVQDVYGMPYFVSFGAMPAFSYTNGVAHFVYALTNSATTIEKPVVVSNAGVKFPADSLQAKMTLNKTTGVVTGSFKDPGTGRVIPINAVIIEFPPYTAQFQDYSVVVGYFLTPTQSAFVLVGPPDPQP